MSDVPLSAREHAEQAAILALHSEKGFPDFTQMAIAASAQAHGLAALALVATDTSHVHRPIKSMWGTE